AIKDVEVEFTDGVNVIVGPNAIGKTTILEAIRLAKALLAPRTANEATQALLGIGAVSQHNHQQFIPEALATTTDQPVKIRCTYALTAEEIASIEAGLPQIVTSMVQARLGGNLNAANLTAFFSSPAGKQALGQAEAEIKPRLERLKADGSTCRLNLSIDFKTGRLDSDDPVSASLITFLDQRLSPTLTKFSYFPADRALPRGEQPVQIGFQDAIQQLESHNSQPQLKYARLKNTIFSTIIQGADAAQSLTNDFKVIFSGLLRGKEMLRSGVNMYGQLTTLVKDVDSGREFDIDAMSSGEKGLILTFLLIARTVANDGIILLDEPELHLNPAICKNILSFLIEEYVGKKRIQAIICSHSPEILAGAFGREECSLYHLVSGTNLTRVRHQDIEEISQALRRLGTSESEELLYKGTIFVEGDEDVELLETGFASILGQYKLKALGGRKEVEKQIKLLLDAEGRGGEIIPKFFIFDRDGKPTNLQSSKNVKILQWDRHCLENYLIDFEALTDLLKDGEIARSPLTNEGAVIYLFRETAMSQLDSVVIRAAYDQLGFDNLFLPVADVVGKTVTEAATVAFAQLQRIRNSIGSQSGEEWSRDFEQLCRRKRVELEPLWSENWQKVCDGKRLFVDFRKKFQLRIPSSSFKRRLMIRMSQVPGTENWRAIEGLLRSLIQ
ncbi:MAG TPA: AAA family ATPase, partial [Rhizomicrobium sp.]|nr:AAA family ATPase [Rhizomicrobium sp.]